MQWRTQWGSVAGDNIPVEEVRPTLTPLVVFGEDLAYVTASVHERTRGQGISLGDCACLALALSRGLPAVTSEEKWEKCDVGVRVIRIR